MLQVRVAAVRGVPHVRAPHAAGGALAHFGQPRHYVPVPEASALDCVYPPAAPVAGATGASAAGRRSTALGEARRIDVKTTSMRGVAQRRSTLSRRKQRKERGGDWIGPSCHHQALSTRSAFCLLMRPSLPRAWQPSRPTPSNSRAVSISDSAFLPRLPASYPRTVLPVPVLPSETHLDGVRFHGQRVSSDLCVGGRDVGVMSNRMPPNLRRGRARKC